MTGFGKPTNLSNTQGQVGKRVLQVRSAAVGRHVYVAWGDHSGKQSQVLLRTSNNSGKSFSSPIGISTPSAMGDGDMPELAATGKFVYILYWEFVGTPTYYDFPPSDDPDQSRFRIYFWEANSVGCC
jgi:hypothetical protein